jgi:HEAT repeat protein
MRHPLLERLACGDAAARADACRAVATDAAGALLVDPLAAALADPAPEVARAAGEALVALARSGAGQAVVPLVRRALHGGGRVQAALVLARLEPPGPGLLPALVEGLAARDGALRWAAARVLVDLARLHPELVPVLPGLVGDDATAGVRRMAVFCLRELAPDLPAAAEALASATRDRDLAVRRAAVTAAAGLVDPPVPLRVRLVELLDDPDAATAALAALALGALGARGPRPAATELHQALAARRTRAAPPDLARALDTALARLAPAIGADGTADAAGAHAGD